MSRREDKSTVQYSTPRGRPAIFYCQEHFTELPKKLTTHITSRSVLYVRSPLRISFATKYARSAGLRCNAGKKQDSQNVIRNVASRQPMCSIKVTGGQCSLFLNFRASVESISLTGITASFSCAIKPSRVADI